LTRYSEVAGLPVEAGEAPLAARQDAIDRCFAGDSVETILAALAAENSDWAKDCARKLQHRAPLALKVTLRQLRLATTLTFDEAMVMEYRLARHFMDGPDFFEGVRAAVIDKDRKPRWNPASLDEAGDELVQSYFTAADGPDLDFG
jgi:enoyl-CoA hydratase